MSADTALEIGRLYVQLKRIADLLTSSQQDIFVQLPGLHAYWPGGIRGPSGDLIDHSSAGQDVGVVGLPVTGFDGNSYIKTGGGTNYFTGASVGQTNGVNLYIDASIRGITIGGWFMIDVAPAANSYGIVSKWGGSTQRAYGLRAMVAGTAQFTVSGTGANLITAESGAIQVGVWNFLVGRFTPGTEVAVFANSAKVVNTTAIPATIFVSSQAFEIGRFAANDSNIFVGKSRDVFFCFSALEDDIIQQIRLSSQP